MINFYVRSYLYYCMPLDQWMMKYVYLKSESLTCTWDILKAMLPLADLSVFHGQEELVIKVLAVLLSSGRDETLYTWTMNPISMPSINNQRRYKL